LSILSTYRANGKLLLTGEYLVLYGAKVVAVPLKVGQQLSVSEENETDFLDWRAFYNEKVWFSCELNPISFAVQKTSHPEKAEILSQLFRTIKRLNPEFGTKAGVQLSTTLETNPDWGFGSSSTLVSLLSQWAGVDPFALNAAVFNGSGFDAACATADGPIFYVRNKPNVPIGLDYPFSDQLFLVYSGQKKKTATAVSDFLKEKKVSSELIDEVSVLSDELADCLEQPEFNRLIRKHEEIVGALIGQRPVKEQYFTDFEGDIKSLGAWGGDFYLVSTGQPFTAVKKYFETKGLFTMLRWDDLILKRK
jgi:mevalonate kinase